MMRASFLVLTAMGTLTTAWAGHATVFSSGGCAGTKVTSQDFVSGACQGNGDNDGSALITCTDTSYTAQIWLDSQTCGGAPDVPSFTGTSGECNTQANFGSIMVDCSSSCFSSATTMKLESGAVVPMSAVHVGDRVLSMSNEGKPMYDKVFRITHHEPTEVTAFRRITTSSGDVLEITAEHLLHIGTCCNLADAVPAHEVVVGSTVFLASGEAVTVTSVESVVSTGSYNLHTLGGNLVVNNVVATHFGNPAAWSLVGRSLAPYWYQAVNAVSAVIGAEDASQKPAEAHASLRAAGQ